MISASTGGGRSALFCIYSHNTQGGIEIWLREVVAGLREAGWRARLALARGRRFNDFEAAREIWGEGDAIEIDGRTGTDEGRIRGAISAILESGADVVAPLGLAHVLSAAGRLKAVGRPIRVVNALHAINPPLLLDALAFAPVTDLCVGVNPLQIRFLRARGYEGDTACIPNGHRPGVEGTRASASGRFGIVFVGRLEHRTKRVLDIPTLAKELLVRGVDFELTVVGDGPDRRELEAAVDREGLSDRVVMTGWLSQESIRKDVFPRAAVLILLSPGEASPLVPLEALSAGVVPVTSSFVGLRSLGWCRDGETVMTFPPGELATAADAVAALFKDGARLAAMSLAGREISKSFTWDRSRRSWVEAFENLVRRPPGGARAGRRFPLDIPAPAGRLDRAGVGPALADRLRKVARRFPRFDDGWGEWPGTLAAVPEGEAPNVMAELERLEREREADA